MRHLCILTLLLFYTRGLSYSSRVIINEVMANPKGKETGAGSPGDRNEFIELYNISEDTIDLSGWWFTDFDATDSIVPWEDTSLLSHYPGIIIKSMLLYPHSFALILDPEYTSTDTTGGYYEPYDIPPNTLILTIDNTTLGNGLSNNDPLLLYSPDGDSSSFGTPFDEDGFPENAGDGISWERIEPSEGDVITNWDKCKDPSGCTPGRINSVGIEERGSSTPSHPLYPNPSRNIPFPSIRNTLSVYNSSGMLLKRIDTSKGMNIRFPPGIYFLLWREGNRNICRKVIVLN